MYAHAARFAVNAICVNESTGGGRLPRSLQTFWDVHSRYVKERLSRSLTLKDTNSEDACRACHRSLGNMYALTRACDRETCLRIAYEYKDTIQDKIKKYVPLHLMNDRNLTATYLRLDRCAECKSRDITWYFRDLIAHRSLLLRATVYYSVYLAETW
jgi:hypothetical protein